MNPFTQTVKTYFPTEISDRHSKFARTCYFPILILERTRGCTPPPLPPTAVSLLNMLEPRDNTISYRVVSHRIINTLSWLILICLRTAMSPRCNLWRRLTTRDLTLTRLPALLNPVPYTTTIITPNPDDVTG